MRNLGNTLTRLAAIRGGAMSPGNGAETTRLRALTSFGSNPGALGAQVYTPPRLSRGAPLVVVLHGCTQTAAAFDAGSGWSRLADRDGFALLYPEQQRSNNPALCFNWFAPEDARRGSGEAASIMQMIETFTNANTLDRRRVFITGLSAGGAMASVMLAAYPELFAGGAIIAGLPFGVARTVPEAFDRMRGNGGGSALQLATSVQNASGHHGDWPTISIWHGTADQTVASSNGEDLAVQWRGVHALGAPPSVQQSHGPYVYRAWRNKAGRDCVLHYAVKGMGHGVPIDAASGIGAVGPYMIDAGVSSTDMIARSWGISDHAAQVETAQSETATGKAAKPVIKPSAPRSFHFPTLLNAGNASPESTPNGVRQVIENALRKAGLM
ncbi:MAG: alpha/beta hydrolase family esterase [Parvularculaceae bacterium]